MKDGNGFSVSTVIRSLCVRYFMTKRVAILTHGLVLFVCRVRELT